jgi:DNA-binding beta-propeller fold protein YncE
MKRRGTLRRCAAWAIVSAIAVLTIGVGTSGAELVRTGSFGTQGSGAGQFQSPRGVAINETTGHVYVTDSTLNRISEFTAAGTFVQTWGRDVDQNTSGNVCTAASGHTCQAGSVGTAGGAFNAPSGIGVDSASGAIYVEDAGNNRVQKFDANGVFVLMWGKAVDAQTGGNLCTAASGHTCKEGTKSGSLTPELIPTEDGAFNGLGIGGPPKLTVDAAQQRHPGTTHPEIHLRRRICLSVCPTGRRRRQQDQQRPDADY